MSGFSNSVLGGMQKLIRAAIQSPNFLAGTRGWIVRKDGSVEFTSGIFRGTIINSAGIFQYSGAPAAGNLIETGGIAIGGTDSFGNNYLPGSTTYNNLTGYAVQSYQGATNFYVGSLSIGWTLSGSVLGGPTVAANNGITVSNTSAFVFSTALAWIFPSGDITGGVDLANISGALSHGYTVMLIPGIYYVNAVLEYPGGSVIWAPSPQETIIRATASMNAVLASTGWNASVNVTSQSPVKLTGFRVDANGKATYGIVSQNFWSYFTDLEVTNALSDDFRFDAFGANGTTEFNASVTAVENHVTNCQFRSPGGSAFHVHDSIINQHFTDGWLTDCVLQGSGSSVSATLQQIDVMAGWKITGNHLYGAGGHAMGGQRLFNTRVIGNYIEPWGTTANAGSWAGMAFDGITDAGFGPSVISGNTLNVDSTSPGNAASTIDGISCRVTNGATGELSITGNTIGNPEPVAAKYRGAITLQTQNAAAVMNVVTTGNLPGSGWTNTVDLITNGGTINHTTGV